MVCMEEKQDNHLALLTQNITKIEVNIVYNIYNLSFDLQKELYVYILTTPLK